MKICDDWAEEVIYLGSPLLRQIASYSLRRLGGALAPRLFKQLLGDEMLRVMGKPDFKASLLLGVVVAYRRFEPEKGNMTLINWLSWVAPYETSKHVYWRELHPIEPFEEAYFLPELEEFEASSVIDRKIDILAEDLGLDKQRKLYYSLKALEEVEYGVQ
jgi:hypothetical protein